MPIYYEEPKEVANDFKIEPLSVPQDVDRGLLEAAFNRENDVYALHKLYQQIKGFQPDPEFNIGEYSFEDPVFQASPDSFRNVESADEYEYVKRKILEAQRDTQVLENSGFLSSFGAQTLAGLLSPTMFMPGGVIVKGGIKAQAVAKTAGSAAVAGGAAIGVQETILHSVPNDRTNFETAANITAGAALSGAIGGAIGMFVQPKNTGTLSAAKSPKPEQTFIPNFSNTNPITDLKPSDGTDFKLSRKGVTTTSLGWISPVVRQLNNPDSPAARRFMATLDNGGFVYEDASGKVVGVGTDVANNIKARQGETFWQFYRNSQAAIKEGKNQFSLLNKPKDKEFLDLAYEFIIDPPDANRINNINETNDTIAQNALRIADEHRKMMGKFEEEITEVFPNLPIQENYYPHVLDEKAVLEDREGLKNVITEYFKEEIEKVITKKVANLTKKEEAGIQILNDLKLSPEEAAQVREEIKNNFGELQSNLSAESSSALKQNEELKAEIRRETDPEKRKALREQRNEIIDGRIKSEKYFTGDSATQEFLNKEKQAKARLRTIGKGRGGAALLQIEKENKIRVDEDANLNTLNKLIGSVTNKIKRIEKGEEKFTTEELADIQGQIEEVDDMLTAQANKFPEFRNVYTEPKNSEEAIEQVRTLFTFHEDNKERLKKEVTSAKRKLTIARNKNQPIEELELDLQTLESKLAHFEQDTELFKESEDFLFSKTPVTPEPKNDLYNLYVKKKKAI